MCVLFLLLREKQLLIHNEFFKKAFNDQLPLVASFLKKGVSINFPQPVTHAGKLKVCKKYQHIIVIFSLSRLIKIIFTQI